MVRVTRDPEEKYRIGLFGLYGWGNLGDAAIQEAVMQNLRERIPDAEFVGLSLNPADTEARHHIEAYPITSSWRPAEESSVERNDIEYAVEAAISESAYARTKKALYSNRITRLPYVLVRELWHLLGRTSNEVRFFLRCRAIVRGLDLLVFSGGGLLDDYWGGPWWHPFTFFRWALAARLSGTKAVVVSVGASQLESPVTRWLVRAGLRMADYRSFREKHSVDKVAALGLNRRNYCVPDLAYSLKVPAGLRSKDRIQPGLIAISPIAWMDPRSWPTSESAEYNKYVNCMADLIGCLIRDKYRVSLFASDIYMDKLVVDDILHKVEQLPSFGVTGSVIGHRVLSLEELLARISESEIVIASRLHGVLLSHLLSRPVLALSYDVKVDWLMTEMEQEDYCLSIADNDVATIMERLKTLARDGDAYVRCVDRHIAQYRHLLDKQYNLMADSGRCRDTSIRVANV